MTADEIAQKIDPNAKKSGASWIARCPAHEDGSPSLSISDGRDGGVLVHCHAGCPADAVLAAVGLSMSDLAPPRDGRDRGERREIVDTYDYVDESGKLLYQVVRFVPKDFRQRRSDGRSGWVWNLEGVRRVPYRLPELLEGVARNRYVFVTEGEKDADSLVALGLVATTNPMGSQKFPAEFARFFKGAKVVVVPDHDKAGALHLQQVATTLKPVASELRALTLPGLTGEKGNKDVTDWLIQGYDADDLKRIVLDAPLWEPSDEPDEPTVATVASVEPSSPTANDEGWEPAVPLDSLSVLPTFPLDTLPTWMGDYIKALAVATQTPVDLGSVLGLAALSAACAGRAEIVVNRSWVEQLNLYVAAVMESGEGKTPPFRAVTAPFFALEKELLEACTEEIEHARTMKDIAEKRHKKAIEEAGNAKEPNKQRELEAAARDLASEVANIAVPVEPQLIVEDVTSEYLARALAEQDGRVALFSDEGGPFAAMAGRYDAKGKGGPKGSLDVWLKAYDGTALRVGRLGRSDNIIEKPCLTLGLATQPHVLRSLEAELRQRGMLPRFYFALPDSTVGWRDMRSAPVPEALERAWSTNMLTLARTMRGVEDQQLVLSEEAREAHTQFREWLEPRLRPTRELASIKDWATKFAGRVARIAGLLHLATHYRDGWTPEVSLETMERAIKIGRHSLQHALKAFDVIGSDERLDRARFVLRFLSDHEDDPEFPKVFTRRSIMQLASRGQLPDAERTQPALDLLTEFQWIRRVGETKQGTFRYEMRPDLGATLATLTTVTRQEPPSVATVATVAGETVRESEPVETTLRASIESVEDDDPEWSDLCRQVGELPPGSDALRVLDERGYLASNDLAPAQRAEVRSILEGAL